MKRQTLECLFVAVCLTVAAQAMAEEAVQLVVVPVDKEPRHRLAFEDQYIRVFDVRIAPGDTTLYHSHQRDSIYIPISGPPPRLWPHTRANTLANTLRAKRVGVPV